MIIVLKLLLAPLLILQGLYVRKKALILPEPQGERSGVRGEGESLSLLILGDSAACGVGVAHQEDALTGQLVKLFASNYRITYRLIAKTGETTASCLKRLQREDVAPYSLVIINLGVNDVTRNVSPRQFCENMGQILRHIDEKIAAKHIILCGLPPVYRFPLLPQPLRFILGQASFALDKALAEFASSTPYPVTYFKQDLTGDISMMAADGFHPGKAVYARWAMQLKSFIDKLRPFPH